MMFILLIIVVYIVYEIIWKKKSVSTENFAESANEILKKRYIQGEIDEEMYQKLKKTINE
ncbi:MAG TPA: hypothetical protein DCS67_11730 [Clostridiales bacterium UBA8960]|nr:hypothetical protein [Clostridiales bacterium UBA8960]